MHNTIGKLLEKAALDRYPDIKSCADALHLNYALFRKTVAENHVPKDEQLLIYADKLRVDHALLIRLAHYQRAPARAQKFLKDLRNDNGARFVERTHEIELSNEERDCLDMFLEVLRSKDNKVVSGLKVTIEAFNRLICNSKQ